MCCFVCKALPAEPTIIFRGHTVAAWPHGEGMRVGAKTFHISLR